ncbi:hypothetical protein NBH19_09135 [Rhizobium sp. S95]|uniref:DUF3426 domain-containing protein n=1 Tax=Ciceribacter sichuanensis TaxID=2949647 RepID=A0AAJ1F7Z6_9HYPH|nr:MULTISPECIES: hypothetical protein [unclassified Ciceribacter]MCM2396241.1 hypothetical protein [Ciceribacter sp. S95]MCM2402447.1 hypothetical protein [Ciceribacter sp. S153]MCO5957608.1 hypothetical protein [Ciceribacter sp. S101]
MSAARSRREPAEPVIDLLPPDRRRPPHAWPIHVNEDIVDAHFVTVREARRSPQDAGGRTDARKPRNRFASRPSANRWTDTLAAPLRSGEQALQRLSEKTFAVLVSASFAMIFAAASVYAGVAAQEAAPLPASGPLDITHVSLTPQDANGMRVLLVNAIVENRSQGRTSLPKLRADLVSGGQVIASTYIDSPVEELDAGHSRGISARLQHPGGKLPELRLSFEEADASRS